MKVSIDYLNERITELEKVKVNIESIASDLKTANELGKSYVDVSKVDTIAESVKKVSSDIEDLIEKIEIKTNMASKLLDYMLTDDGNISFESGFSYLEDNLEEGQTLPPLEELRTTYDTIIEFLNKHREKLNAELKVVNGRVGFHEEWTKTGYSIKNDTMYYDGLFSELDLMKLEMQILINSGVLKLNKVALKHDEYAKMVHYEVGELGFDYDIFLEGKNLSEADIITLYIYAKNHNKNASNDKLFDIYSDEIRNLIENSSFNTIEKIEKKIGEVERVDLDSLNIESICTEYLDCSAEEYLYGSSEQSAYAYAYMNFSLDNYDDQTIQKWKLDNQTIIDELKIGDENKELLDKTLFNWSKNYQNNVLPFEIHQTTQNLYSFKVERELLEYDYYKLEEDFEEKVKRPTIDKNKIDEALKKLNYQEMNYDFIYTLSKELECNPLEIFKIVEENCDIEILELCKRYKGSWLGLVENLDSADLAIAYKYMTEDEKQMYNYLYNTQGIEKASNYIYNLRDHVNDRAGKEAALKELSLYITNEQCEIVDIVKSFGKGAGDGLNYFFEGLNNAIESDGIKSDLNYKREHMAFYLSMIYSGGSNNYKNIYQTEMKEIKELDISKLDDSEYLANILLSDSITQEDKQMISEYIFLRDLESNIKTDSILNDLGIDVSSANNTGFNIGNMAIPMCISLAAGLSNPVVGKVASAIIRAGSSAASFGTSIYGNQKEELLQQGFTGAGVEYQAVTTALSEMYLQLLLGGIPGMSIWDKGLVLSILGEAIEEGTQEWINAYSMQAFLGQTIQYDNTKANSEKAAIQGAVCALLLSPADSVVKLANGKFSITITKDEVKNLAKKHTSPDGTINLDAVIKELEAKIKTAREKAETAESKLQQLYIRDTFEEGSGGVDSSEIAEAEGENDLAHTELKNLEEQLEEVKASQDTHGGPKVEPEAVARDGVEEPASSETNPAEPTHDRPRVEPEAVARDGVEEPAPSETNPHETKTEQPKKQNPWVIIPTIIGILSLIGIPIVTNNNGGNDKDEFYLNLKGDNEIKLYINNEYLEPGYEAYDSKDGDLTEDVVVDGEVKSNKIGKYVKTYTVTNSRGETISKQRTINIVARGSGSGSSVIEITLDNFNEQIEKGKVYNGIRMNTTSLMNQYISKFKLEKSMIYALSLTSIVTSNSHYSDINSCNSNYLNTEASAMIVTNGTIERVYNNENKCFDNYGVFYFTSNKLNYTKVTSESINKSILDSKTRNTFVYKDILVANSSVVNSSETLTMNNAICQSGSNTLKLFSFDKETTYNDIANLMVKNNCQTGILLTDGDTILYKSQYSSTLNIEKGTNNLTDSIMFIYERIK